MPVKGGAKNKLTQNEENRAAMPKLMPLSGSIDISDLKSMTLDNFREMQESQLKPKNMESPSFVSAEVSELLRIQELTNQLPPPHDDSSHPQEPPSITNIVAAEDEIS